MKGKLGSTKRFGTRYGAPLKQKLAKIEAVQRAKHKCPRCAKLKVKRVSFGIWECLACGLKYASKAYSTEAPRPVIEVAAQEVHSAKEEAPVVEAEEMEDAEEQDG